jgi:hypothetical protein
VALQSAIPDTFCLLHRVIDGWIRSAPSGGSSLQCALIFLLQDWELNLAMAHPQVFRLNFRLERGVGAAKYIKLNLAEYEISRMNILTITTILFVMVYK